MIGSRPWRVARVAGVDLLVSPSMLVMGLVLALLFADRFDGRTATDPYVLGFGYVIGLYVSVLLHEVAHVVAARGYGLRVPSVTLHVLGGETVIEGGDRRPVQSLVTAIVGPLASLVIGLACLAGRESAGGTAFELLTAVGVVNVLVAAFNMVPGLPLDGGQVLRALIWMISGSARTGTVVAAWIGRVAAVALVGWLVLTFDRPDAVLRAVIVLLVAGFLWTGATSSLRRVAWEDRVAVLRVRDLVRHEPPPPGLDVIAADLHGTDLLDVIAQAPAHFYAVAEGDGTVVGLLSTADVQRHLEAG